MKIIIHLTKVFFYMAYSKPVSQFFEMILINLH